MYIYNIRLKKFWSLNQLNLNYKTRGPTKNLNEHKSQKYKHYIWYLYIINNIIIIIIIILLWPKIAGNFLFVLGPYGLY